MSVPEDKSCYVSARNSKLNDSMTDTVLQRNIKIIFGGLCAQKQLGIYMHISQGNSYLVSLV